MLASFVEAFLARNRNIGTASILGACRPNHSRIIPPGMNEVISGRDNVQSTVRNDVRISNKLDTTVDKDTFWSTFYDSRICRVPFIGRKSINGSVEFIRYSDVIADSTPDIISTKNIFVHSWGNNPTMIWPT